MQVSDLRFVGVDGVHPADKLGETAHFDPAGNKQKEKWDKTGAYIDRLDEWDRRQSGEVKLRWPAPTVEQPDELDVAEFAAMSDVMEATDGCEVEPDGVCPHGHPSWAVKLGFI